MLSRKRRRMDQPKIHPNNRYSEKPPDFSILASLYPSFHSYVFTTHHGRPAIDWTDFNATRELTRVLLHHDHGVHWWIPDGQLCPTVPNRLNYIHWISDLLLSEVVPKKDDIYDGKVRGFDIGTGANCIYPLLGASLFGWTFVGSDVTDVALECARKNVEGNPHLSHLIEIRDASKDHKYSKMAPMLEVTEQDAVGPIVIEMEEHLESQADICCYAGPPILVDVVKDGEKFDFCMCNPPFFKQMEEASLNPKTSCGGTYEEMVCPGGEKAFITRIIEDSIQLKHSFRWFTSMVGRKANLKVLVAKLHDIGVTVVKTTEFVQGKTARWGLAWSFSSSNKKSIPSHVSARSHHSFMLEGLQRQYGAFDILKASELFLLSFGSTCKLDLSSFFINVRVSVKQIDSDIKEGPQNDRDIDETSSGSFSNEVCFRISVFEQTPGTVLVKASLQHKDSPFSGAFLTLIQNLEDSLKEQFMKKSSGQGNT